METHYTNWLLKYFHSLAELLGVSTVSGRCAFTCLGSANRCSAFIDGVKVNQRRFPNLVVEDQGAQPGVKVI